MDGPQEITGIHRQVIALKRLSLTDVKVERLPRNSTLKNIKKAWNEQGILEKWKATAWAKKLDQKRIRAGLNDFDRFKVMIAKKQRSKIIGEKLAEMSS